jgi:hypothetical protein
MRIPALLKAHVRLRLAPAGAPCLSARAFVARDSGARPVSGRRRRPSARSSSPSEKVTDSLRAFTSSTTVVSSSATFGLSQQDRLAKYATGVSTLLKRPALSSRHPNNGRLRSNPRYSDDADSARRSRMLQRRPQRLQTNQTCPPTTEKCWTSVASQDGQRCSSRSCGRSGPVMVSIAQARESGRSFAAMPPIPAICKTCPCKGHQF